MTGTHCLADLLSPKNGGHPAKIEWAPDPHVTIPGNFEKREGKRNKIRYQSAQIMIEASIDFFFGEDDESSEVVLPTFLVKSSFLILLTLSHMDPSSFSYNFNTTLTALMPGYNHSKRRGISN